MYTSHSRNIKKLYLALKNKFLKPFTQFKINYNIMTWNMDGPLVNVQNISIHLEIIFHFVLQLQTKMMCWCISKRKKHYTQRDFIWVMGLFALKVRSLQNINVAFKLSTTVHASCKGNKKCSEFFVVNLLCTITNSEST